MQTIHVTDFGSYYYGLPSRAICGAPVNQDAVQCIAPHDSEALCPGCQAALPFQVPGVSSLGGFLSSEPARALPDGTFAADISMRVARLNAALEVVLVARAKELDAIIEWRLLIASKLAAIDEAREERAAVA